MMESVAAKNGVTLAMNKEESLVLFEMLQRLVEENEARLLPLLHSSAEFAVLCRLNSHLEKQLPEALQDNYEDLLHRARTQIIKQSGRYEGIEES